MLVSFINGNSAERSPLRFSSRNLSHQPPLALEATTTTERMHSDETSRLLPGQDQHGNDDDDDNNTVSWDGPEDPQNPANWGKAKIWGHIVVVSLLTFLM
jgi:hypothetical protein